MVDFNSLAGGALREKFNLAIAQIGRDILDPNKDPEAARGIAISLKFLPKEGIIGVEFDVQTKLAKLNKENLPPHAADEPRPTWDDFINATTRQEKEAILQEMYDGELTPEEVEGFLAIE